MVNFFDITLNLAMDLYYTFRKPNKFISYTKVSSNYPRSIIDSIVIAISMRISNLPKIEEIFYQQAPVYNKALNFSGFKMKISYLPNMRLKNKLAGLPSDHVAEMLIVTNTSHLLNTYIRILEIDIEVV